MPRQARIDAPGLLHHVISRGLERRKIFTTGVDYKDFIKRIEICLKKSPNQILAWALMPNHFHFLMRSGRGGVTNFMRRLMSGYATVFNARHKRVGYLFQNRFKSIVCEEDVYLKELVRYIHLNPLRAGLVKDMEGLKRYPFSGHAVLLGEIDQPWQERSDVLMLFGKKEKAARKCYLDFVKEGLKEGKRSDLVGGGLKRSNGKAWPSKNSRQCYDNRVLGSSDFVENLLKGMEKAELKTYESKRMGWESFISAVAAAQGVKKEHLFEKGRQQAVSDGKAMLIYAGTAYFGRTNKEMARLTGMAEPPASRAKERGRVLLEKSKICK